MRTQVGVSILLALSISGATASAQQRPEDRRRFMAPGTKTTDDPRHVPMPAGEGGPEAVTVLRGGRIFDGTGAPARPATLVLERNLVRAESLDLRLSERARSGPAHPRQTEATCR